jgi:hypothetical protein
MLGDDTYGERNKMIVSATNRPEVFNGQDYFEVKFGNSQPLICAGGIFAQYASNIYNMVLVFKANESWSLIWTVSADGNTSWSRYRIDPNVGCPAPGTLKILAGKFEKSVTQTKTMAIWRAHNGIYISNGQAPYCVSDDEDKNDISNVFDQTKTPHVNLDMVDKEESFIDEQKMEYHWLWASGTNTTLDKEYVLDLKLWRWFEIDRTSGLRLQCGVSVQDTRGNKYSYGFVDTGYMERLEYGATFDGQGIVQTYEFGGQLPVKNDLFAITQITRMNVISKSQTLDALGTITHYLDEGNSGSAFSFSMADASHGYANDIIDNFSLPAIFHSFKFHHVGTAGTKTFEPIYFGMYYQNIRDHTR